MGNEENKILASKYCNRILVGIKDKIEKENGLS